MKVMRKNMNTLMTTPRESRLLRAGLLMLLGASAGCLDADRLGHRCRTNLNGDLECVRPEEEAPALTIFFPPPESFTDARAITLRGTVTDAGKVSAVRVNHVPATFDDEGNWQIAMPLTVRENHFVVEAEDLFGNRSEQTVVVWNKALVAPSDVVLDEARGRALVVDEFLDELVSIDVESGERRTLAVLTRSAGPSVEIPRGMALDTERGRVLVTDVTTGALMSIDLDGHALAIVSGPDRGTGEELSLLSDLVLHDGRALVVDYGRKTLVSVDLDTGDRDIVSDPSMDRMVGQGPALEAPTDVTIDPVRNRALVADIAIDALVGIDLATGDRSLLASPKAGCPLDNVDPNGLAYDATRDRVLIVGWGSDSLIGIDLETCAQWRSDAAHGVGPAFGRPERVAIDSRDRYAYVADAVLGTLVRVDLDSGDRTIMIRPEAGTGEPFVRPARIALDEEGDQALVMDAGGQLIRVHLRTGRRERVEVGGECRLDQPVDVAWRAGTRHAVVMDIGQKALMRIDLETGGCEPVRLDVELQSYAVALEPSGDVLVAVELGDLGAVLRIDLTSMDAGGMPACEVVSGAAFPGCGAARGTGPVLGLATSLALDQANNRLLVGDFAFSAVMAIDLATGDRTIVSDLKRGGGEPLVRPHTIVLTSDGTRAMVLDEVLQAVVSIDLATGDRRIVAGQSSGAPAVAFDLPRGLALYEDAERALLIDEEQQALFYVDLVTGERVILSQ
jgi:DNA-binding beta-propeller fold protein YncE